MFKKIVSQSTFVPLADLTTKNSITPEIEARLANFSRDLKEEKLEDIPLITLDISEKIKLEKEGVLKIPFSSELERNCFYRIDSTVVYVDKISNGQLVLKKFEG